MRREVAVKISGTSLIVRSCSTDFEVALSALALGEYDGIQISTVDVIFDAGANIGSSAIAFRKLFPTATIICIEPEPGNIEILKKNAGKLGNVEIVEAALAADTNPRPLFNRGTGAWGFTVTESDQVTSEVEESVSCVTVSSILEIHELDHIDILKLDIEGGEKEVLESSESWIESVKVVLAELHDRITPGCTDAFENATKYFEKSYVLGEKVVAQRAN